MNVIYVDGEGYYVVDEDEQILSGPYDTEDDAYDWLEEHEPA